MLQDVLTLGDKIDIKPLSKDQTPLHNARSFVSQLLEIIDKDTLHIATPIMFGRVLMLNTDEYLNLFFYTSQGLYKCNCKVLGNHKENNTVVTVVRIITKLEKYQRRQYFRLECLLDIEYRLIPLDEELLEQKILKKEITNIRELEQSKEQLKSYDKNWMKAIVIDVSGGGARFFSAIQQSRGDKIKARMDLAVSGSIKRLVINAKIIASSKSMDKNAAFENRIEFLDIRPKDREDLIKYIFEQDRIRRNK
ncbi:MAG: flagellar brake protein [Mobilitalea sp.]